VNKITIWGDSQREYLRSIIDKIPIGYDVVIKEPTRTSEQNKKMWAMLNDISSQIVWHANKLTADEWKDVFTAALKRQRAVPGIDGGFVVIGLRTSKMSKQELADLIELIYAFGTERGVVWGDNESPKP
jgi:hypothetical protein